MRKGIKGLSIREGETHRPRGKAAGSGEMTVHGRENLTQSSESALKTSTAVHVLDTSPERSVQTRDG